MNDRDGKERIYIATVALLNEKHDVDKIMVQQIAERAGVAVGMISYHFGSKRNLLIHVARQRALHLMEHFRITAPKKYPDPVERLKALLKELFELDSAWESIAYLIFTLGPLQDEFEIPLYMVSILREIAGGAMDERKLRVVYLQLFEPIYTAACIPGPFRQFCGVDIYDKKARDELIDLLVDNAVKAL